VNNMKDGILIDGKFYQHRIGEDIWPQGEVDGDAIRMALWHEGKLLVCEHQIGSGDQ